VAFRLSRANGLKQDGPIEARIGSLTGKIIVIALIAFFVWGYAPTLAAKVIGLF
jgi:hypothetical protein